MGMRTCLGLLMLVLSQATAAADIEYSVYLTGRPAGEASWSGPANGAYTFEYSYADRGRGPSLRTEIRVAADGILESLTTRGNDYFKGNVDERFERSGDAARWTNRTESGTSSQAAGFYTSFDGGPQEVALLAAAAMRAPDQRLALLPAGSAQAEKLSQLTLEHDSQRREVTLYAVSGLDFEPSMVWLTPDGRMFASVSGWLTTIERGWEGQIDRLFDVQTEAADKRGRALAATASRPIVRPLAFSGVGVFDPRRMRTYEDWSVLVIGERIVKVGPRADVAIPADAEIVDGKGKTLLPGLWDMHTHLSPLEGLLDIAAGVTSARDLGNVAAQLEPLRRQWTEGELIGPRVFPAGIIDGRGQFQAPSGERADTVAEGEAAVATYAALGYRQVKLYSSLKPELVAPIAMAAHARRMRVSGHIPAFMNADQAIRAGYDEIQHLNMVFLNFWPDVQDTRTPLRFTAVADRAADLDQSSEPVQRFIDLLVERNIVIDPTVSVFEDMFLARPGQVSPGYVEVADRLPTALARGFKGGGLPVPDGRDEQYRRSFEALLKMIKRLEDSGVRLVAGTDALAGFALYRELELYVQAGLPAPRVLQIATLQAAQVAGQGADLGTLEQGKLADLVLVDGDPTQRISDLRRPVMVVKGGRVYDPAKVYAGIGVSPARPD